MQGLFINKTAIIKLKSKNDKKRCLALVII